MTNEWNDFRINKYFISYNLSYKKEGIFHMILNLFERKFSNLWLNWYHIC